jgi:biopolymer transport protein ExbD
MSISRRKSGQLIPCPACGAQTRVPDRQISSLDEDAEELSPGTPEELEVDSPDLEASDAAERANDIAPVARAVEPESIEWPEPSSDAEDEDSNRIPWRRRSQPEEDLDLTAMVDVVFQLLIFFMVTASFTMQKSIEMPSSDEPRQGAAPVLVTLDELESRASIVRIEASGQIMVDDDPLPPGQSLKEFLEAKMSGSGRRELIVAAHDASPHYLTVEVVDTGNSIGVERIRLARFQSTAEQ